MIQYSKDEDAIMMIFESEEEFLMWCDRNNGSWKKMNIQIDKNIYINAEEAKKAIQKHCRKEV